MARNVRVGQPHLATLSLMTEIELATPSTWYSALHSVLLEVVFHLGTRIAVTFQEKDSHLIDVGIVVVIEGITSFR